MHLTIYFLALFFVPAFAAPPPEKKPPPFKHGEIVGVRPGEYETKPKGEWKDVSIHPGVVLGTPHPVTGKFPVAMISSKLPNNPPQVPVKTFYHGSGLDGNIRLDPPKQIENAKAWKNKKTGGRQSPMSHGDMQRLRDAMVPHQGWRSPSPPATPPPGSKGKQKEGQSVPRRPQPPHVNAHASSSRHPAPPRGQRPPPVNAHASSSRQPVPARGPHSQGPPSRPPAHINQRPHAQGPRPHPQGNTPHRNPAHPSLPPRPASPAGRNPARPASPQRHPAHPSLPRRPPSPQRGPAGGKGKQPVRGKREFIRRRAVRSEY